MALETPFAPSQQSKKKHKNPHKSQTKTYCLALPPYLPNHRPAFNGKQKKKQKQNKNPAFAPKKE
jgi:hypothetical protein